MEKKCFVIMPAGDPDGYAQGHFNRVYQYLVIPACKSAGFTPTRADDPGVYSTALDIIKNIIESDMVICDLSSKNASSLYGFAIRQAVDIPVVSIKDMRTTIAFDVRQFGGVEYDESLRIDTVQQEIESLSEALNNTFANKSNSNSLLTRLGIGSTPIFEIPNTFVQEESTQKKETPLPFISPLPDYVGDPITRHEEIDKLKVGDTIFHMNYGKGEIAGLRKMAKDKLADIHFESGAKTLVIVTSGLFRKVNARV